MGLTVAEKTHWKDRIARRIGRRIDALVAKNDPALLQRVESEARTRACDGLGIGDQEREVRELEARKQEIENRQRQLRAEQGAIVNGSSPEHELERAVYRRPYDSAVDHIVERRARALEDDVLAESETGRQVLALKRERENLLDTVWLATSCRQIRDLWQKVTALLEETPTPLETHALELPPMEDEGEEE